MDSAATQLIAQAAGYSYIGLFVVGFLANVFVPVPEEIVLLAIGYLVGTGAVGFIPTVLAVILGALLSDFIFYELSYRGNKIVKIIYEKYFSRVIPLSTSFIEANIKKIIFISRFLIQFRFLGPFLAGYVKFPRKKFLWLDLAALAVYTTFFIWLGFTFQGRIERIVSGIGQAHNIIIAIAILIAVGFILQRARHWALTLAKRVRARWEQTGIPGLEVDQKHENDQVYKDK